MDSKVTEYNAEPCWMREYCIHRTGACWSSQPEDDGCPVYRCFKSIFEKQGLIVQNDKEPKTLITAQEARKRTNQIIKDSQFKYIKAKIRQGIENGDTITYIDSMDDCTRRALEDLGYKVKHFPGSSDFREREYWSIAW